MNVVALLSPFQATYYPVTSVDHHFLLLVPYIGTALTHNTALSHKFVVLKPSADLTQKIHWKQKGIWDNLVQMPFIIRRNLRLGLHALNMANHVLVLNKGEESSIF
ncbi:hypothetical protein ABE61_14175 [Lysinibacillus sphaericus]|nr:hypothetical protein [Lysinibacillus sphaericus]MBG9478714.1 hypothetical protein [Lysinibacillus sphaericus]MBG9592441.1 hypothetical protein [Lysinibacillus sphaericus]